MKEPVLHVGILTETSLHFELTGDFLVEGKMDPLKGACHATLHGTGLILETPAGREEIAGVIRFIPREPLSASFSLSGVTIGVDFHWQQKEDQRFVGALELLPTDKGIVAVNIVPIEEYLKSVISSEMSADSSLNLLKAHAITSRSWLIAQIEKSRRLKAEKTRYRTVFESEHERIKWYDREDHALFDVCADDHCQRYQGITKAYTTSVRQAIDETRGNVLMSGGEVCDARFSKSCGGASEAFHHVWEDAHFPYLTRVFDVPLDSPTPKPDLRLEEEADRWIRSSPEAFCNTQDAKILSQVLLRYDQTTTDFYRWQVRYSQEDLASLIAQRSGIDFGGIVDLVPVERGDSGRLIRLKIVGTKRTMTIGKELEIRRTLSRSHLYSSAFVVDTVGGAHGVPGEFLLTGAGWGHGVGLCQIGAAVMGERGYAFEAILHHYFVGATLEKRY